jgi:uncharacterized protein (DUF302 family)
MYLSRPPRPSPARSDFYVYLARRPGRTIHGRRTRGARKLYYIVDTKKPVNDAARDLEAAVKRQGFGVLHVYDLKQTLKNKGVDLPIECRIYEVCNPQQAGKVLAADPNLNMALPCRISVYEHSGSTRIGTIKPSELLGMLTTDTGLADVAATVEQAIEKMIDEAAAC